MSYSIFNSNYTLRYSQVNGWQPQLAAAYNCMPVSCLDQQQPGYLCFDVTFLCSMKNPRKFFGKAVNAAVSRGLVNDPKELADLPFSIEPNATLQEDHSPEEASFRNFLQKSLSRHEASQALRERIKNKIKNLPD